MYQQERMDEILKILKKYNYVTVDFLVEKINYSPASIRRDLTLLQKQGLVVRSYGGVRINEANLAPFRFRQHSMKIEKNKMAKAAADLVNDNDTVYLDGGSTIQYIGHFLTEKKKITVLTCNMILADYLSEHGIVTYCTGGRVVEYPGILGGPIALDTLSSFNINIAFFSSNSIALDGKIFSMNEFSAQAHRCIRDNAKKLVYLCGSDKVGGEGKFVDMTLDDVDYLISDVDLPNELKKTYKNTTFIVAK